MTFQQLRKLCLTLPDVEERETWGEATYRVRDKIFAMGSPEGEFVSIKASLDDQSGLIAIDPETFAASAYTGRYGWVRVRLRTAGLPLMERLVTAAWKRTAAKRAVAQFETAGVAVSPLRRFAPPPHEVGRRGEASVRAPGRSRASSTGTAGSQPPRRQPRSR